MTRRWSRLTGHGGCAGLTELRNYGRQAPLADEEYEVEQKPPSEDAWPRKMLQVCANG